MSTSTPEGADGPSKPADDAEVPDEELDAELVEEVEGEVVVTEEPSTMPEEPAAQREVAGAPPVPVAASASDGDEEVETIDVEPDPTGEVIALPAPKPAPARPALPGMPRSVPKPPPGTPVPAPAPAVEEPQWPTPDETIAAAAVQAQARSKSGGLVEFYEAELSALGPQSRARQAVYAHELGELAAAAGDEGAAVKAWARALQADPSLRPNLWAIRRAFERRAMWPNVLRLIDAELRFAPSTGEKAELLIERGAVLEDRSGDPAGATAAFEAATKEDAGAIRAFMALERRLLEDATEPERHRRVLGGLAAATRDPARRAALLIDLARLESEAGGEGITRARAALDEALQLELGENGETHFAGSGAPASLDELERLAVRAGRPEWRAEALEGRLRLLDLDSVARPPASASDAERIARGVVLRLRLAALAEERKEADETIAHLEAAASLAAHDPGSAHVVAVELGAAAMASGRAELAARVALAAAAEAPQALRGALLLEAVDGFERAGLLDDATAAGAQAEALGLADSVEARARRRSERAGDDAALLKTYVTTAERAVAGSDPATAAAALARAGAIAGEQLGQHDEALALRQRGLSLAPAGPLRDELGDAVEWTLARLGRYDEWSAVVDKRLGEEPPGPRRVALLERRAGLLAERLGDVAGATTALEEVSAARPDDLAVRYDLVVLARFAGDPARAAAQLGEIISRTSDDARKGELELERGGLLVQAGDAAGAEASFRAALGLAPGDSRARAALEELFEHRRRAEGGSTVAKAPQPDAASRADGLIAALRAELDANSAPERAVPLLSRLAELHERERGDATAAAAAYQEMFDRAGEPDEQAAAVRGLVRAYTALGDRDKLIAALEREHELLGDSHARALQRARIAWVKERGGHPEAAEDDHRRLLDGDQELGADLRATARLGRLRAAYRTGEPGELSLALGAVVGAVDPELVAARAALDLEHAAAVAKHGEHDEAAVVAARAMAAMPDNRSAQLAALWTSGRRNNLRGVTSALFALGDGAAQSLRAPLVRRAALLSLVSGADGAEPASRLAAVGAKDDVSILVRAELASDVDVLGDRLALAEGQGRTQWLMALAEGQAARGELVQASATLGQLLELEPRSLFGLELDRRVRKAAGDKAGWARRTLALAEQLGEAERAAALLSEAAEAFEALGDVHAAVYAYREALQRTPFDGAVHTRARALLGAEIAVAGEGAELDSRRTWARSALLELFDLRLANVDDLPEKVTALCDRAALYKASGDRQRAEADLRAVLELDPDEVRGLWPLIQLCAQDGARLLETRELIERMAALQLEPAQRRAMFLTSAEIEARADGDLDRAVSSLEEALAIEEDLPTLRALATLLSQRRSWQRAVEVRRRLIERVQPEEGARLELEVAQLYLEGFRDAAAAREAALRALALEPGSKEALALLSTHAPAAFADSRALQVLDTALERARGLLSDEEARREAAGRIAVLGTLRGDEELRVLATQLEALYDGRAVEARAPGSLHSRPVADVARQVVRSALLDSPLTALFAGLAESAAKLHPLATAQAGKLSKPSGKQRDTELAPLLPLARLLGVAELELMIGEGGRIESDHEHVVLGRAAVPLLDRPAGRFRAARALALFADRLGALDRMDDAATVAFVAAALALAKAEWPAELAPLRPAAALVDDRARALDKVISRKEKKALMAVVAGGLASMPDPRRFRAAALASASRAALFLCADLSVAAEELGVATAMELGRVAVTGPFIEARGAWTGGRG